MKVLIACEYSGRVREAFRLKGHEAFSCDIIPSSDNSPNHIQKDISSVKRKIALFFCVFRRDLSSGTANGQVLDSSTATHFYIFNNCWTFLVHILPFCNMQTKVGII